MISDSPSIECFKALRLNSETSEVNPSIARVYLSRKEVHLIHTPQIYFSSCSFVRVKLELFQTLRRCKNFQLEFPPSFKGLFKFGAEPRLTKSINSAISRTPSGPPSCSSPSVQFYQTCSRLQSNDVPSQAGSQPAPFKTPGIVSLTYPRNSSPCSSMCSFTSFTSALSEVLYVTSASSTA